MKKLLLVLLSVVFLLAGCSNGTRTVQQIVPTTQVPQVFEEDIPVSVKDVTFVLTLSVGESVDVEINNVYQEHVTFQGEIITIKGDSPQIFVAIRDPYGNMVVPRHYIKDSWKFPFLPATNGEYTINIKKSSAYFAHLKITIYPK